MRSIWLQRFGCDMEMNENGDGKRLLLILITAMAVIAALVFMGGCSPKVITVPEVHTEYVYRDRVDSLTLHDSVYIKEYVKGDTVRIVEYRYRDRFQYVYSVDTVMVADTVQVERETVVVQYENKLRKWQKSLIGWGLFCLLCLVGYIFLRIKGFKLLS